MSTIPFPLPCPRLRERAAPRASASTGHVVSFPLWAVLGYVCARPCCTSWDLMLRMTNVLMQFAFHGAGLRQ